MNAWAFSHKTGVSAFHRKGRSAMCRTAFLFPGKVLPDARLTGLSIVKGRILQAP